MHSIRVLYFTNCAGFEPKVPIFKEQSGYENGVSRPKGEANPVIGYSKNICDIVIAMNEKIEQTKKRECNPFEDTAIAEQWISSVEGERGKVREREIYPMIEEWASAFGEGARITEIGSGQGICSQYLGSFAGMYIGVEPSVPLTERAKELYSDDENKQFILGNAYKMPTECKDADGVFSMGVWFHLADLDAASKELARILKHDGKFNIITTNPESYDIWRTFFDNYTEDGKMISGKVNLPVTSLSRNDFYMHTMEDMLNSLKNAGLKVELTKSLGAMKSNPDTPLFVSIQGTHKKTPMV